MPDVIETDEKDLACTICFKEEFILVKARFPLTDGRWTKNEMVCPICLFKGAVNIGLQALLSFPNPRK